MPLYPVNWRSAGCFHRADKLLALEIAVGADNVEEVPECLDALERRGQTFSEEQRDAFKAPILAKYERESSCYYSSSRLWDDGVIDPADTRKVLGMALASTATEDSTPTKFGVFRM